MVEKGYVIERDVIVVQRGLTELDLFLKRFLRVLKDYSDYLVVSGYVSIASGRTRAIEDIDILVPLMDKKVFSEFFYELNKGGFWCYRGGGVNEVYEYIG